jgi:hypothetical protein
VVSLKTKFVANIPELKHIEETLPTKVNIYTPEWFKKLKPLIGEMSKYDRGGTVKRCPSFVDWFKTGYILPMWADSLLNTKGEPSWKSASGNYNWDIHHNEQFLNHIPNNPNNISAVFKAECPWFMITPKGYSVLQLPLFYNFNEWEILPGIIDTDKHHELNQQIIVYGEKEVFIERGTPLVMYIPFKREEHELEIIYADNMDKNTKKTLDKYWAEDTTKLYRKYYK